jgi:hypothetical protein
MTGTQGRGDRIGQWCFALMCVVVTAAAAKQLIGAPAAPAVEGPVAPIAAGTRVPTDAFPDKALVPRVVLTLSPACGYCTESMPFYRRLAALDLVASGSVRISAAAVGALERLSPYLDQHELTVSSVVTIRSTELRIEGTPTLVLLDPNGVVINSWAGLLDPDREAEVVAAIRALVVG